MIYSFNKIKKFKRRLSLNRLAKVMRNSTVVTIGWVDKFGDGTDYQYFIKKTKLEIKSKYSEFFGYDVETIKQLTLKQFEIFLQHKKTFEDQIIHNKPIIVTTVGKATTKIIQDRKIKRVIMDEATMVKENEAFLACLHAH